MGRAIKNVTFIRLHEVSCQGEKHDSLIMRLIGECRSEEKIINISDDTVAELLKFSGCADVDDALNVLMDKYKVLMR